MTNSSRAWLRRHLTDPFVKEAQRQGYASRAAFKLLDIQEKDKIFKKNMTVVDLGSSPGGWSQVAMQCIGDRGRVVAIDLLPMDVPAGVTFIQGDFNDEAILQQLFDAMNGQLADIIISDMAPNLSGQKSVDLPRTINLLELALDCVEKLLKKDGTFLFKAFNGVGLEEFVRSVKTRFSQVKYKKPAASRAESTEVYVLATGFVGFSNR